MTIETKELVISEELKELDDIFERINKKRHKTYFYIIPIKENEIIKKYWK
ncbi:unknown [Clostridium sp. CAG:524]|nr:unknown [Clostridium sp. CAG:524]